MHWHYYINVFCMMYFSIVYLLLMQSGNGAQFLNISFLFLLFGGAAVPLFVFLEQVCMPHYIQINLTLTLTMSVIISTYIIIYFNQVFCPKFSWLVWCKKFNKFFCFFFWIPFLYFCIKYKITSNILYLFCIFIFCIYFVYFVYLSLGISLSISFVIVSGLFCSGFVETFVIF